jgi:hypothetical protein
VQRGGTAPLAHRFALHTMIHSQKRCAAFGRSGLRNDMQTISTLKSKAVVLPPISKVTTPRLQPAAVRPALQRSGLTREELRQIVIDMIG